MKAKLLGLFVIFLASPITQALACSVCFGDKDAKSTEHMAVAIWALMGVAMSVLGGLGAFSFHLWRHAHTPLEPHEQLVEEDFEKYE
jgi:hypothetical protein